MNDRLRDRIDDADPARARAAALAASVPELAASDVRKERVRRAVLASPPRRGLALWLLRPSVALLILLLGGAVMAATLGRAAIVRAVYRVTGAAAPSTIELHPSGVRATASGRAPASPTSTASLPIAPSVAWPAPPPSLPTEAPVVPPRVSGDTVRTARAVSADSRASTAPTRAPTVAPASQEGTPPAAPAAKAPPAQESLLLMSAVRALRHEHDPARATKLLDDYLRRYPSGALAEEALALAIEAASARGDGRAPALARTYLQKYPQGRFASAARAAAE